MQNRLVAAGVILAVIAILTALVSCYGHRSRPDSDPVATTAPR